MQFKFEFFYKSSIITGVIEKNYFGSILLVLIMVHYFCSIIFGAFFLKIIFGPKILVWSKY